MVDKFNAHAQCECRDCQNNKPAAGDPDGACAAQASLSGSKKRKLANGDDEHAHVNSAQALLECASAAAKKLMAATLAPSGKVHSDKSGFLLSAPQTPQRSADYHLVIPLTPVEPPPASTNLSKSGCAVEDAACLPAQRSADCIPCEPATDLDFSKNGATPSSSLAYSVSKHHMQQAPATPKDKPSKVTHTCNFLLVVHDSTCACAHFVCSNISHDSTLHAGWLLVIFPDAFSACPSFMYTDTTAARRLSSVHRLFIRDPAQGAGAGWLTVGMFCPLRLRMPTPPFGLPCP